MSGDIHQFSSYERMPPMKQQPLRHSINLTDEQKSAAQELRTIAQERIERKEKLQAAQERIDATQRALSYAETQLFCTSATHQDIDTHRAEGARARYEEARETLNALSTQFAAMEIAAKERERELHGILSTISLERQNSR
jgi:hypothetical protein